jgi:hypothetical protein
LALFVAISSTNPIVESSPQIAKVPASKAARNSKAKVSPASSPSRSSDDELLALRARNKILTEALEAIKESASDEMMRRYDLVWFAKYRCKFSYIQKKMFYFKPLNY